jgi:hypothetical protein
LGIALSNFRIRPSPTFASVIKQREAFSEVLPHYSSCKELLRGAATTRRIHAGSIDACPNVTNSELARSPDRDWGYAVLSDIAQKCEPFQRVLFLEVISFDSTLILDSRRKLQPQGMMRIAITQSED